MHLVPQIVDAADHLVHPAIDEDDAAAILLDHQHQLVDVPAPRIDVGRRGRGDRPADALGRAAFRHHSRALGRGR